MSRLENICQYHVNNYISMYSALDVDYVEQYIDTEYDFQITPGLYGCFVSALSQIAANEIFDFFLEVIIDPYDLNELENFFNSNYEELSLYNGRVLKHFIKLYRDNF